VRSVRERVDDISEDPVKRKRAFMAIWAIAYSMLILGFLLMVWVFFMNYQTT
jgi:predicted nucleic acid-binding Zn ribbon protein